MCALGKGVSARSWLYVNNNPVVCTRAMEVAALVSSINPSLNATHDAFEVALLQQELLWLLYDLGHLKKYPMAIGNLGDLEEISTTTGRFDRFFFRQLRFTSKFAFIIEYRVMFYLKRPYSLQEHIITINMCTLIRIREAIFIAIKCTKKRLKAGQTPVTLYDCMYH